MKSALNELAGNARRGRPAARVALIELFRALANDEPWREQCAQWSNDRERHEDLRLRLVNAMVGAEKLESLAPHNAFALLAALDETTHDRGVSPKVARQTLTDGTRWYIVPRRAKWRAPVASQPAKLQRWLPHVWIVPGQHNGLDIEARDLACLRTKDRLRKCVDDQIVRAALASFGDQAAPDIRGSAADFHFAGLTDDELRWATVEQALAEASAASARILVLPELTMPAPLRQRVRAWLSSHDSSTLALVVPGSFHEQRAGERRNRTELISARGSLCLEHDKLRAFSFVDNGVRRIEDIRVGAKVTLVNSPLGLVATPICRDFCDLEPSSLWDAVGLGLALVPSMGDDKTMRAHASRSDALAKTQHCLTAVANQPPPVGPPGGSCHVRCGAGSEPAPVATRLAISVFELPLAK